MLFICDLTWPMNLKNQQLTDTNDNFYFNNTLLFYCSYEIKETNPVRFLNYDLLDVTHTLEGKIVTWDIIGNHIIYKKNNTDNIFPVKALIFYDSFLLNILPLYFDLFNEIYLIKTIYSNDIIDKVKPDYIFEFRVERFLF